MVIFRFNQKIKKNLDNNIESIPKQFIGIGENSLSDQNNNNNISTKIKPKLFEEIRQEKPCLENPVEEQNFKEVKYLVNK